MEGAGRFGEEDILSPEESAPPSAARPSLPKSDFDLGEDGEGVKRDLGRGREES